MDKPLRVLIIDDSAFNRRTLIKLLESVQGVEVAGTAVDGSDGLKQAAKLKPDLITLDMEMPVMDGFTFLRILMQTTPTPVIVISSRNADANVFKAMELGAVDFIPKPTAAPSMTLFNIKDELCQKVTMLSHLRMENVRSTQASGAIKPLEDVRAEDKREAPSPHGMLEAEIDFDVVAIGSSTGGPPALSAILPFLPDGFPASVVISQHMPPGFTKAFAERLNRICKMRVKEAVDGEVVKRGDILIAPGGYHLSFKRCRNGEIVTNLLKKTEEDTYAPSVDIMFSSVAAIWGKKAMGIILTGMGYDGKEGVIRIKEQGGYVIAESEETSIVFGMPESAIATGMVDEVIPLYKIGSRIVKGYMAGLAKRA